MLLNIIDNNYVAKIIDEYGNIYKIGLGADAHLLTDSDCELLALQKYAEIKEREANPPKPTTIELRKKEYAEMGLTPERLIIALWEKVVEGRSEEADKLQAERVKVEEKYPK